MARRTKKSKVENKPPPIAPGVYEGVAAAFMTTTNGNGDYDEALNIGRDAVTFGPRGIVLNGEKEAVVGDEIKGTIEGFPSTLTVRKIERDDTTVTIAFGAALTLCDKTPGKHIYSLVGQQRIVFTNVGGDTVRYSYELAVSDIRPSGKLGVRILGKGILKKQIEDTKDAAKCEAKGQNR